MSPPTLNASSYIQWQVIRNNSAFLKRQRGIPKTFSTEPFNLKKINSIRFNGLVNKKGVDVQLKYKKDEPKAIEAVVVKTKNAKSVSKPVSSVSTKTFGKVKDSRRIIKSVKSLLKSYKPSMARHAAFRVSKYLRSSKASAPKPVVKTEA